MPNLTNWLRWRLRRRRAVSPAPTQLDEINAALAGRDHVFSAPPFTPEMVAALKLIAPQFEFGADDYSRQVWEADQNGACWAEFDALEPILRSMPTPARVLEIGPGLGRSVVFFSKHVGWGDARFHLYEGEGTQTRYTDDGPRFDDSFIGNFRLLADALAHNGISNYEIQDAAEYGYRLDGLPGPYDVVYSFFAVGAHWSLEHFIDEIDALLHDRSVAFFTVLPDFRPFEQLDRYHSRVVRVRTAWPKDGELRLLVLSRSPLPA